MLHQVVRGPVRKPDVGGRGRQAAGGNGVRDGGLRGVAAICQHCRPMGSLLYRVGGLCINVPFCAALAFVVFPLLSLILVMEER